MSLDVYLEGEPETVRCACCECGHEHDRTATPVLYSSNITHNLNRMAEAAGLYQALWRPEEVPIRRAGELIVPLRDGLKCLEADPAFFQAYDSPNGWGLYEHFIPWVREYLEACETYPDASVRASR